MPATAGSSPSKPTERNLLLLHHDRPGMCPAGQARPAEEGSLPKRSFMDRRLSARFPGAACELSEVEYYTSVMARRRNNPLALAALVTLFDEDRHPYDIAQTLKCRRHDQSMRLNFGSLYSVMKTLERNEYVEAVEVEREGRRPERTVYRITDDGVFEAQDWLADLVARPVKEYVGFEAALSLIGAMNPDDVIRLFRQRIGALKGDIAKLAAGRAAAAEAFNLPRLFLVEDEYVQALKQAELVFVENLLAELSTGTFPGLDQWREWATSRGSHAGEIPQEQLPDTSQRSPSTDLAHHHRNETTT